MLRIRRLTTRNWCQHQHKTIEFGTVTSIVGPIGSGKSNILNALCFALTGDIRNDGVKKDNVYQLAEAGVPADVTLEFSVGNVDCEIRRSIRSPTVRLRVGSDCYDSSASVASSLRSLLRLDAELVQNYVFVDQWKMFDFLSFTDAIRERNFAKIFGLERAAELYNLIGDCELPKVDVPDLEKLRAAVTERQAQVGWLQVSLSELEQKILPAAEVAQHASVVHSYPVWQHLSFTLANLQQAAQQSVAELESVASRKEEAAMSRVVAEASATSAEKIVAECEAALNALTQFNRWSEEVSNATAMAKTATLAVARSETKLEAAKLRFRSDRLGQLAVEDNRISANMAVLQHQHEKLAKLAGKKSGTLCPTCGSPISGDPDAERKAIETQMTLMNRELTSMREEAKELQRAQAAINLLATEVSQAQASAVAAGELVKRLESVRPGSFAGDEALLRQQRLQATTTIGKYQQLVLVCNQLDNAMAAASSKRDAVLQQLATTSAEFQAVAHITKESYEKASAICSQQAKLEGDIRVLRRDLELRLEQLVEADRLVKEAEAKQLEAATVEMAANNLQQLRAVFHRDAAPAIFARDSLLALSEDINVNLEEAEADFRVASVDGIETKNPLSFRLIFPSGVETTAKRLSGGQKVLLAICFRLSLQRQFGHNLGLLCMDEPTAGLNQANVDRVGKLFSKIRSASSTEGLQLIFVTHDVSLSRFCDQVIDLATG